MSTHEGHAVWDGDLKRGNGSMNVGNQSFPYTFKTRFGGEPGISPERLIGAAHAGCFSMAFASTLAKAGYEPHQVDTKALVELDEDPSGGFAIQQVRLRCEAYVGGGIDEETFQELAAQAKAGCPVSKLVHPVDIQLEAVLGTRG